MLRGSIVVFTGIETMEMEMKLYDPSLSTHSFLGPDGSSWKISKATFEIPGNLLLGANLENIRLEGVNALSLNVDGNLTISKNLTGSPTPALTHLPGGTLTDGYDGFYADDPRGLWMGRGSLYGFNGGMGPVRGKAWAPQGLEELRAGVVLIPERVVAVHLDLGIRYGSGGLDLLMGGSGGGLGHGGEAGAGGGAPSWWQQVR